jgi:hypothetical protein
MANERKLDGNDAERMNSYPAVGITAIVAKCNAFTCKALQECHIISHTGRHHQEHRNDSSLHSIATTPILDSRYSWNYSYCDSEQLLERWIHGYVALLLIRSFTANFIRDFM